MLPGKGGPRGWDRGPHRGLHRRAVEPEGKKSGVGRPREEKTQAGGVGQRKEKWVCEEPREKLRSQQRERREDETDGRTDRN